MTEIPESVLNSLSDFMNSLHNMENVVEEFIKIPYSEKNKVII